LVTPPTDPADRRSLSRQAGETAAVEGAKVEVEFGEPGEKGARPRMPSVHKMRKRNRSVKSLGTLNEVGLTRD
jgi:hypothetical protein